MEGQGQVKRNYRARYCNTERQVVDVQPGGNVLKYIQDCFETAAREHPVLRPSLSTSSCSSPDLSQTPFPPPSEKKKSLGSLFVNSLRNTFSTTHSKAQPRESCSSGDDVFVSNSPGEDETCLGSPAVLIEETTREPEEPEEAPPDQNGRRFPRTDSPPLPSSLPWNTGGSESENEGEFLIAESFGGPSTSWLLQPQKNSLPEKRSLTSPPPESDKTAKEHRSNNVLSVDRVPVVELGNRFSQHPQPVLPTALQSPTSRQIKEQKCPKNVFPEKQAQRQRKNIKSSRDAGRKNESKFLRAESFGGSSTTWLSEPQQNSPPEKRSLTSPPPERDRTTKEHSVDNVLSADRVPVVEQGNRFSEQPQSVTPTALQSSPTRKQIKKQKRPKTVFPKKQAPRQRKNTKSSARGARKKCRVPVSEDSPGREPKELSGKQAEVRPRERLSPLGKRSAHVAPTFVVSPEGDGSPAEVFSSTERQSGGTVSEQYSFVRAINMNDLSGPVYNQNEKASFEREIMIRGNVGNSYSEPSAALEKDSPILSPDSLKDKAVRLPDDTTCLRRSKRLRLKPLEYWRGERVMYKMKSSGVLMASGIISPKHKEPSKLNRMKQPTETDLEKLLDNANLSLKDPSQPAHVFDLASKQEVLQECVSSGRSHLLFFNNEDVSIYKYFSTPLFSAGKLILKPLKEKGSQYSSTDTLVFHIVKGRLLFTLYGQCYSLCAGNDFFVPAGNIYNIQNITNEECILFFTHIKGNRLEAK